MQRISEYRFHQIEGSTTVWLAEASDLGFAVGVWPEKFAVVPVVGADVVFEKSSQIHQGGWRYVAGDGRTIEVLND
jgi:hypothetical protein